MTHQVEIPYGCYWSTPFVKWQGSLQHLNSVEFAAWTCERELKRRSIDAHAIDHGVLGITVIQHHSFYGLPWLTGLAGLKHVTGPTLSQACATGVRLLLAGTQEIESGLANASLRRFRATAHRMERTCTTPNQVVPAAQAHTRTGYSTVSPAIHWGVIPCCRPPRTSRKKQCNLHCGNSMRSHQRCARLEQYREALANDRAFQRRFMSLPFEIPRRDFKKIERTIDGDEGIYESTPEAIAKLRPMMEGGSVTFGGQTHPSDGNAAVILEIERSRTGNEPRPRDPH